MQTFEITAPILLALVLSLLTGIILSVGGYYIKKKPTEKKTEDPLPLKRAVILCSGRNENASPESEYQGYASCATAKKFFGGPKNCKFGCIGLGDCAAVCPEKAIFLCEGLAVVDRSKCTGCGKCKDACPQNLIRIYPKSQLIIPACSSKYPEEERTVSLCATGCASCGICEKVCAFDAVHIVNGTAKVDPVKCVSCGKCMELCPRKTILEMNF